MEVEDQRVDPLESLQLARDVGRHVDLRRQKVDREPAVDAGEGEGHLVGVVFRCAERVRVLQHPTVPAGPGLD
jgi:hypothetical protein